MRVLTDREIITSSNPDQQFFSNADAKKDAAEKKKTGFFSKEKRTERKTERKADKAVRVEKRAARRAARKAKHGSRPLQQVGGWFKDNLPKIKINADGSGTKVNPTTGEETTVPKQDLLKIDTNKALGNKTNGINFPPLVFDKKDLAPGKKPTVENVGGTPVGSVNYAKNEVSEAEGPTGDIAFYKNADTEVNDGEPAKEPMSSTTKWLIWGGVGIVGLSILGYILKSKFGNKGK